MCAGGGYGTKTIAARKQHQTRKAVTYLERLSPLLSGCGVSRRIVAQRNSYDRIAFALELRIRMVYNGCLTGLSQTTLGKNVVLQFATKKPLGDYRVPSRGFYAL